MTNTEAFVNGAVIAYKDTADWIRGMAERLPEPIAFLSGQFLEIADGIDAKAKNCADTFTNEAIADAMRRIGK